MDSATLNVDASGSGTHAKIDDENEKGQHVNVLNLEKGLLKSPRDSI